MASTTESLLAGVPSEIHHGRHQDWVEEELSYEFNQLRTKREIKRNAQVIAWAVKLLQEKYMSEEVPRKFQALIREGKEEHQLSVPVLSFHGTQLLCDAKQACLASDVQYEGETVATYLHPSCERGHSQGPMEIGYNAPSDYEGNCLRLNRIFSNPYPVLYIAAALVSEKVIFFLKYAEELESPSPTQFKVFRCEVHALFKPRGLSKWTAERQDAVCAEWGIKTARVLRKEDDERRQAEERATRQARLAEEQAEYTCPCCSGADYEDVD